MLLTKKEKYKSDGFKGVIFLIPAIVLMAIFFVEPVVLTVFYSFTNLALTGAAAKDFQFVGLDNYKRMFADHDVAVAVKNTIIFLIGSAIIGQQILGFVIAFFMKNKNKTFRRIIGAIVLAGWVTPEVVCAICLFSFFSDEGTLNSIIGFLGIAPVAWLYVLPMFTVIVANIWHGTAFSMLVFQAALDDVPQDIEEAAVVDGASKGKVLWHITLPYIKGTISTNMMLITLMTLGTFGLIYTMTGGGPGTKTTTLPIYMYNQAFVNFQLGYGTAISMILLTIGIIFSFLYVRTMKIDV